MWCGNTTEVSLPVPGMRIKEHVSLNLILAEILHKVYSFPSVKCTSFAQNISQTPFSIWPPKKSKTTSRGPPPPIAPCNCRRAECGRKNTLGGCVTSLSSPPAYEGELCLPLPEPLLSRIRIVILGGELKGAKSSWIDLHLKRLGVSSGRERGKKQERQELV